MLRKLGGSALIGLILIATAIFLSATFGSVYRACTETTVAVVKGYEEHTTIQDGKEEISYNIKCSYQVDGKTVESVSVIGEGRKEFMEGASIEIKYNPDKPLDFVVNGSNPVRFMIIICLALGIFMIVKGVLSVLRA